MGDGILIVEDDAGVADVLGLVLGRLGVTVEHAGNGVEALARIGAGGLGLVVLDLGLPDLDGVEVCRQARAGGFAGRILVLSARFGADVSHLVVDAGADDFMRKPFAVSELRSRATALLA